MLQLLPSKERNKILRLKSQASPAEIAEAENDILNWQKSVVNSDKLLKTDSLKATMTKDIFDDSESNTKNKKLPAVRGSKDSSTKSSSTAVSQENLLLHLNKIEEKEKERLRELSKQISSGAEMAALEKRALAHLKEVKNILVEIGMEEMSDFQMKVVADRERTKGNEFYRAGETQNAYKCYTTSLALDHCKSTTYSNRAAVCNKLERYDVAEDDCSRYIHKTYTFI